MPDLKTHSTTLCGVVDFFGGYEVVARILNVSVKDLQAWLDGKARPPIDVVRRLKAMSSDERSF